MRPHAPANPPRDLLGQIAAEPMTGRQRDLFGSLEPDQEPREDPTDEQIRRLYPAIHTPTLYPQEPTP